MPTIHFLLDQDTMTKPKPYSEEEKKHLKEVCVCGLTQKGVDKYTRLFGFPPQPIDAVEAIEEKTHPQTILGLVAHPAYKHWTLEDALNAIVLQDLKYRDLLTSRRNKPKAEIQALVDKAVSLYKHFDKKLPYEIGDKKLRAAMITRVSQWTPTKVAVKNYFRCDGTVSGIGTESIDYTRSTQLQPGYAQRIEDLKEKIKQARREGDEYRIKNTISSREHRRRKSVYRKIDELPIAMRKGCTFMPQEMIKFSASAMGWLRAAPLTKLSVKR